MNSSETKSIGVLGANLEGPVTIVLNDDNEVFSIDKTTLSKEEAEEGAYFHVTFNALYAGTFTGDITLTSPNCEDVVVVTLNADASNGGTANDKYLNVANHSTIRDAGWNNTYVNELYQYKEYDEQNVGWLTLPIYGAWSAVYYNSHPQKWIETNITTINNAYAGTTWNNNAELLGNTPYFNKTSGNGSPRAIGYNSRSNYNKETVTFYVTNCTAVKLLGLGQSRANSSYPATLNVYECTKNDDGTITPATSTTASKSNYATSGTFVLEANNLSASKIYKVEAATYRSYICEIGFQTPLPEVVTLEQIVNDENVVAGKQYRIVDDNLIGAYLTNDEKSIYCKDDNGFTNKKEMTTGQTDFMTEHGWQTTSWDQSNWIMLKLPAGTELTEVPTGHLLSGVRGTLISKENPTMLLTKVPTNGATASVNFNSYLATNFDASMLAETGNYFFIPAKPMEVAQVMWAKWDATTSQFVVASPVNNTTGRVDGAFYADLTKYYNDPVHPIGELEDGGIYNFTGFAAVNVNGMKHSVIKGITTLAEGDAPAMVVYPLENWQRQDKDPNGTITDIYTRDGYREVVSVEYVNAAGLSSDKPFQGVNIVVTRYSDGSRTTVKKLYR